MNYRLKIGPHIHEIETTPLDENGSCRVLLGERDRSFMAKPVSPHYVKVYLDEQPVDLFVARSEEGTWVWIDGCARLVEDADKAGRKRSGTRGTDAAGEITPPTPASVVRIMVEVDQKVEKGQPAVVVSAMKMEITLSVPYDGTVREIRTEVGAQVSPGEILVDIEPLEKEAADE